MTKKIKLIDRFDLKEVPSRGIWFRIEGLEEWSILNVGKLMSSNPFWRQGFNGWELWNGKKAERFDTLEEMKERAKEIKNKNMKEETISFFQVGTPLALIALGLGYLTYEVSNVVPFIKSPLFFIPACLMLGPVMLLEGFEKDHLWHLGLLGVFLIYSLIFGVLMFIPFVSVWILYLAFIYPVKRESKMNFYKK